MKIDDIFNSNLEPKEKAKKAIIHYNEIVKWYDNQDKEKQEKFKENLDYTFDMCRIIGSNLSIDDLQKVWDEVDKEENMKKYTLTKERFIELAQHGKIEISAKLRKKFSGSHSPTDYILCTPKEYNGGFEYKVVLDHEEDEFVVRDIYTSDLVNLINDGHFTMVYKED